MHGIKPLLRKLVKGDQRVDFPEYCEHAFYEPQSFAWAQIKAPCARMILTGLTGLPAISPM